MKFASKKSDKSSNSLPYFSYNLLGRRLAFIYPYLKSLKSDLARSGMKVSSKAYISQVFFVSILATIVCFGAFLALNILMPSVLWAVFPIQLTNLLTLVIFPLLTLVGAFLIQLQLPSFRAGSRRSKIENSLPITSSYMSVMACAQVAPEKIIRSAAAADPKMILSKEIRSIVIKMDLLGYNILTALEDDVRCSPSTSYTSLLKGFAYTIRTGGNLKKYFLRMTTQFLNRRSMLIQQFLNTLGMMAETYVMMFAAFPLLMIIMLSMMASVGNTMGGLDMVQLMYMMTFILIPVLATVYILMIDLLQMKE